MAALDYVMVQKLQNPNTPMIVNLSMGMDIETSAYNVLDEAVAQATENGVVVVVSAGNSGADASTYSPAHVAEAITVGAYDRGDGFTSYSNYGSAVDILAPGDEVVSLSHLEGEEDDLILMSGTSMAAGHVTGVAALFLAQHPQASPAEVLTALIESGQPGIGGVPSGTTDKTVYADDDDDDEDPPAETSLDFTKAEWDKKKDKIKLEGKSDAGAVVSFYNATTNDFIGTATTDNKGKFKLQIQDFSPAPCTVRAEAGYTTREKAVKKAPADCQ